LLPARSEKGDTRPISVSGRFFANNIRRFIETEHDRCHENGLCCSLAHPMGEGGRRRAEAALWRARKGGGEGTGLLLRNNAPFLFYLFLSLIFLARELKLTPLFLK